MMILIGRFLAKRNLMVLQDSVQMKLFSRTDGDPVTPTAGPFKEDVDSLLRNFGWAASWISKKMGDEDV